MPRDLARYRAAERALFDHYGLSATEHLLRVDRLGARVRVLEVGSGEPVLFLHGSPSAGPNWTPLAAALRSGSGRRCLLLDRPGCGLSEAPTTRLRFPEASAALVAGALDALGLTRADLVGSSLGGAVAVHAAAARPERVRRLVLAGAPAFVDGGTLPLRTLRGVLLGAALGRAASSYADLAAMGHRAALDDGTIPPAFLRWRDALAAQTPTVRNDTRMVLGVGLGGPGNRCRADVLHRIAAPTLYLWGGGDPFGGFDVGRVCASAQPDARLVELAGSGHLPWLDDPVGVARLMDDFWTSSAS